jgi:hypothetical protein
MPIKNLRRFSDSAANNEGWQSFFHKTSGPTPAAGVWVDLSMGAGTPKYNAYVGGQATATPLVGSGNDGIYLGPNPPAGRDRYINTVLLQAISNTFAPAYVMLMDYLLFYPLIDGDNTDLQEMDNTLTLTRNTSGVGVEAMLVCTTPMSVDAVATVNYTNQAGVANRSVTFNLVATANVGTIISAADSSASATRRSAFIPLAGGDSGIRSVESLQLSTPAGGFFSLVLVRPLAQVQMLETGVASEIQPVRQRGGVLPRVDNGAYVNMIALTSNTTAIAPFRGMIETVWQ